MKQGHAERTYQQSDQYDAIPFGEIHELLPLPIATKERCSMPVLIIFVSRRTALRIGHLAGRNELE